MVIYAIAILATYIVLMYSKMDVIHKYRNLYVETILLSMNRQWLVKKVVPKKVLNEVERYRESCKMEMVKRIKDINKRNRLSNEELDGDWNKGKEANITIIDIKEKGIRAKLAVISGGVRIVSSQGMHGDYIDKIVHSTGARVAINAGWFTRIGKDRIVPVGAVVENGKLMNKSSETLSQIVGIDYRGRLKILGHIDDSLESAVESYPALIVNGEVVVNDTEGCGVHPRTVIGQTRDGKTLFLVVGRRRILSLGVKVSDCAKVMKKYKAYNAACLDGGSSSCLLYKDKGKTKLFTGSWRKRKIINAFIAL